MLAKERDDRSQQVIAPADVVLHEVFTVIVVPRVRVEPPDAKKALELLKRLDATYTLRHDKRWKTW